MMFSEHDETVAFLDKALPELLRREVPGSGWRRRLRRRLRQQRWAGRAAAAATGLQVVLMAAIAAAFRPWSWTAGVPWGRAALLAILLGIVAAFIYWSSAPGATWRRSGN